MGCTMQAELDAFTQGRVQLDPPQIAFREDTGEVERLQVMACMLRKAMRDATKGVGAVLEASPGLWCQKYESVS